MESNASGHGESPAVVVAGHVCLDLAIDFGTRPLDFGQAFRPGTLLEVGPPLVTTGGCVSNTGLALSRLGVPTRLVARVGDDLFGRMTQDILRRFTPPPTLSLTVAPGESSSYTVVVEPPGLDRLFLHFPGANRTFRIEDIPSPLPDGARILHFGYPPMLPETYKDGGRRLAEQFRRARERGVCVTLDMALPDPDTEAGQIDWRRWLAVVLPEVDIFLPSLDELSFMLGMDRDPRDAGANRLDLIREIAEQSVGLGSAVVVIKLGAEGLYLRSSSDTARFSRLVRGSASGIAGWLDRELMAPCIDVEVAGTTGAGDATIAGFLASILHDQSPEQALRTAVAVGSFSVEGRDAATGIPSWDEVQERVAANGPPVRDLHHSNL